MNPTELKKIMTDTLSEIKDLQDRIKAIRQMDLKPGTLAFDLWMKEAEFLRKEWMKALDRYLEALREVVSQQKQNLFEGPLL
jgi:hypothetical protein